MKIQNMKKLIVSLCAFAALVLLALVLSGCGGGADPNSANDSSNSGGSTNTNTGGDFAPASIGGKTFNGHIGGTTTVWQIVFTCTGTTGDYSYSENGRHLDSGSYTYTKTSPSTATLHLADGTTLQLTYTSATGGNYLIPSSSETGTFTSN